MTSFTINGKPITVDVEEDTPLLWVLRDTLGLKGSKYGCGAALCGACTVHIDGDPARSCVLPIDSVAGAEVTTIESLETAKGELHPVQQAWMEMAVPQCGYCQSGFIMATVALLEVNPSPTDEDIDDNITNLCRCGTYERVRKAVHRAAELSR